MLIHVHVFTPRDYLKDWAVGRRRMWDEQYLLEAFLSFNREFEVVLAANWLAYDHREALRQAAPSALSRSQARAGFILDAKVRVVRRQARLSDHGLNPGGHAHAGR